ASPPRCHPARCSAPTPRRTPPATSCTASSAGVDSAAAAPPSAPPAHAPDRHRRRTSAASAAAGRWAGPTAPASPPDASSNTPAPPPHRTRQPCPLPQRKVRILHRQRRQRIHPPLAIRRIEGRQFAIEDAARPAVRHDVMHRPQQDVVVGGDV